MKQQIKNKEIEWKEIELKELGEISAGGTPSRSNQEYWGGDIPWLKISNLKKFYIENYDETITNKGLHNSSAKLFKKGTILISIFASLGDVAILKIDSATNQAIAGIYNLREGIKREYLALCLKSLKRHFEKIGRGVAQSNINLSILKNTKIPIPFSNNKPDLQEQERIVLILERAEKQNEKSKKTLELLDEYLKSKFNEMFYEGNFERKYLEEVTNKITDGKHGDCENEEGSGYYFISAKDIFKGNVHYGGARQIKQEGYFEVNKRVNLEIGDVLVTNSGSIGKTAIMNDQERVNKTTFQKSVAVIKPDKEILSPIYLKFFLDTITDELLKGSFGSSQKNLLLREIRQLKIPLPPISIQNEFSSIVEKIEVMKKNLIKSQSNSKELVNSLMLKAFRGEI